MANFLVTWSVGPGITSQDIYLRLKHGGTYSKIATVGGTVTSYNVNGLLDNRIYQFKIVTKCAQGDTESLPYELVNLTCPDPVTTSSSCSGLGYSFSELGGDVNQYDIVLYNNVDVEVNRQTKPAAATVSGVFTGTISGATYKIRVVPRADGNSKTDCPTVTRVSSDVAPGLLTSPSSVGICADAGPTNVTLTATFSGDITGYAWYRNGILIPDGGSYSGAETNSLTITDAGSILGSFVCVATNICDDTPSAAAVISIIPVTAITVQPTLSATCPSDPINLSVTATGSGLTYQWERSTNGGLSYSSIGGATSSTYSIAGGSSINGYKYRVVVTGTCGVVTSSVVTVAHNSTAPNWVNRDITLYYVCVGTSKYYQQIDTNPCSATYNHTQTGALYQADSPDCGAPVCNPPTITSSSITLDGV